MRAKTQLLISDEAELAAAVAIAGSFCREHQTRGHVGYVVSIVVSELSRNILKYAGRGFITLSFIEGLRDAIEVRADDDGPGILSLEFAMQDRSSTGGTLGMGLPGVRRMMDEFKIESAPGVGTHVIARKWI